MRTLVLPALVVAICLLGAIAPTPVEAVVPVRLEHVPLQVPPGGTYAADGIVTSDPQEMVLTATRESVAAGASPGLHSGLTLCSSGHVRSVMNHRNARNIDFHTQFC